MINHKDRNGPRPVQGILIPSWPALLERVLRDATYPESEYHGDQHWRAVAAAGIRLCRETPGAEADFVLAFALLHDHRRLTDGFEPEHGPRAAACLSDLVRDGLIGGAPEAIGRLAEAVSDHSEGGLSVDPSIACCWDADRLNLWRVGVEPDPKFFSTAVAKRQDVIAWSMSLHDDAPPWETVLSAGFDPLSVGGFDPAWRPWGQGGYPDGDDCTDDDYFEDYFPENVPEGEPTDEPGLR